MISIGLPILLIGLICIYFGSFGFVTGVHTIVVNGWDSP